MPLLSVIFATMQFFYPIAYEKRYFASAANVTGIHFLSYNAGIDFSQAVKNME